MRLNNVLIAILFLTLSFGFCTQSLAQNYSDFQVKTTQEAAKRSPIYVIKQKTAQKESTQTPEKKKQTFQDSFAKMIRALILAIALFLGLVAYLLKHKNKFKNVELPNILKNTSEEGQKEIKTPNAPTELDSRDANIRKSVFKFFEINK